MDDFIDKFNDPFESKQQRRQKLLDGLNKNHWTAAAIVVSAYASYRSSKAQQDAADAAAKKADKATAASLDLQQQGLDWQKDMYADFKPYLMKGLKGYQELLEDPSKYKKTPGYMFRLQEGLKSIGIPDGGSKYLSGPQIKAAMRYGQDYATGEYGLALGRQGAMAGIAGQAAGVGLGTGVADIYGGMAGTTMQGAALQGGYMQNAASARASGYMGMSSAVSQGAQNYQYQQNYDAWMAQNKQNNQDSTTTGSTTR